MHWSSDQGGTSWQFHALRAEREKNSQKGDSFLFDILQIKRDAGYLCWDVAAKSLSPCGTKQGFVVGFERAV